MANPKYTVNALYTVNSGLLQGQTVAGSHVDSAGRLRFNTEDRAIVVVLELNEVTQITEYNGFRIGNKVKALTTLRDGWGDVKATEGDKLYVQYFTFDKVALSRDVAATNILFAEYDKIGELTPVEAAELKVGDKVCYTGEETAFFEVRQFMEFVRDDRSESPVFKMLGGKRDGESLYVSLSKISKTLTPAQLKGLQLRKAYRISSDIGTSLGVGKGDVVKFSYDDGTSVPRFERVGDNKRCYCELASIEVYKPTPSESKGLKVGDKAKVIKGDYGVEVGDKVELTVDDGTDIPRFKVVEGRNKGSTLFLSLKDVEKHTETPAELAGLKIGDKVKVDRSYRYAPGALATFIVDDETDMPKFKILTGPSAGGELYLDVSEVTKQEATPLEAAGFVVGETVQRRPGGLLYKIEQDDGTTNVRLKRMGSNFTVSVEDLNKFTPVVTFENTNGDEFTARANYSVSTMQQAAIRAILDGTTM